MATNPAYGHEHQKRRAELLPAAYNTPCPRCNQLMLKGQRLELGHSEDLAVNPNSKGDRIEHADYRDCVTGGNRAAGGRLGAKRLKYKPSRKW